MLREAGIGLSRKRRTSKHRRRMDRRPQAGLMILWDGSRHDWLIAPGASLVFRNLFGPQTDVRLDYKYEWNTSNMTDHTWQNQAATVAFVVRR